MNNTHQITRGPSGRNLPVNPTTDFYNSNHVPEVNLRPDAIVVMYWRERIVIEEDATVYDPVRISWRGHETHCHSNVCILVGCTA